MGLFFRITRIYETFPVLKKCVLIQLHYVNMGKNHNLFKGNLKAIKWQVLSKSCAGIRVRDPFATNSKLEEK